MNWSVEGLARIIEVILAGGAGLMLRDGLNFIFARKTRTLPEVQRVTEQGIIERALLNISKSNDELSDDITRVRAELAVQQDRSRAREEWWQTRWDLREEKWNAREASLLQEIDVMHQKMVELIRELDEMRHRVERKLKE